MAKLPTDLSQLTDEQRRELEEKLKNMSPEELKELQKQQCIFCQIVSGKAHSKKIYEDEFCVVVLDINPAAKGHLLLLPKTHYAILPQIPEAELKHLFLVSKALSQMLLKSLKVDGTNVYVANGSAAGQRAQHFMLHIIPRKIGDGILDFSEKLITEEIMEKVKGAVGDRLNEVLGLKKEAPAVVNEEKAEAGLESKTVLKKREKISSPAKERKEKKPVETTEPRKPKAKKTNAENEEASLDDIASLFK